MTLSGSPLPAVESLSKVFQAQSFGGLRWTGGRRGLIVRLYRGGYCAISGALDALQGCKDIFQRVNGSYQIKIL